MSETAQLATPTADPNAQIANAANAFKAAIAPPSVERDEVGRFASPVPEQETTEQLISDEGEVLEPEDAVGTGDEVEAAEEAQPEPIEMPASWSKDKADEWSAIPPTLQAVIAEREGERDRAVNQKFQEAANAKNAIQAELAEANANRDAYAEAVDTVLSLVRPVKPDPRAYGAGTGNYNREAYDLAAAQYEEQQSLVNSLTQQRQAIAAQQAEEVNRQQAEAIAAIEEFSRPKFLADVPELTDPAKAGPVLNEIVQYAIQMGVPADTFAAENVNSITSAELHIAWKASQYDKIMKAKSKVAETPPPKPAPAVRPGTAISRSATRSSQVRKASETLARDGTVQSGAAIFKALLKQG